MDINTILHHYWLILLAVSSFIFDWVRDKQMDKLISYIPKDKWNKCSNGYKRVLNYYGHNSIKHIFRFVLIILFCASILFCAIGLKIVGTYIITLLCILCFIPMIFPSRAEIKRYKYRFKGGDIAFLVLSSMIILAPKTTEPFKFETMSVVRVLILLFVFWLLFKYIPLKIRSSIRGLIKCSKKFALKEAQQENALRSFLKFICAIALGISVTIISQAINLSVTLSDIYYYWSMLFNFLLKG